MQNIQEIVDLYYKVVRLEKIVETVVNSNIQLSAVVLSRMSDIDSESIEFLQKKFPALGIKKKEETSNVETK